MRHNRQVPLVLCKCNLSTTTILICVYGCSCITRITFALVLACTRIADYYHRLTLHPEMVDCGWKVRPAAAFSAHAYGLLSTSLSTCHTALWRHAWRAFAAQLGPSSGNLHVCPTRLHVLLSLPLPSAPRACTRSYGTYGCTHACILACRALTSGTSPCTHRDRVRTASMMAHSLPT